MRDLINCDMRGVCDLKLERKALQSALSDCLLCMLMWMCEPSCCAQLLYQHILVGLCMP